jgi:hypothetical protein
MASDSDDDAPEVPVVCPDCSTTSHVELSDVAETIERHNDRLHDGEDVAQVDPAIADHVADIVADELGLLEDPE